MSRNPREAATAAPDKATLEEAAAMFKPNARPMLIAVSLNAVLAALCLGIPYFRGQAMARDSLREFASVAGCMLDARPEATLGLALPAGERDRFADRVLHADAGWPKRCFAPIAKLAPEDEVIFLWPSVKTAMGDVRATAGLVKRELTELQKARASGVTRVPERPLLALGRLRAALALLAQATGTSDTIDSVAVAFASPLTGAEPSSLPLTAAQTAATDVWLESEGLHALALDGRGLSWIWSDAGKLDRFRVKRSSLMRGTLRANGAAYAAFAMPAARCAEQPDHCFRRATGVADLALGTEAASNAMAPPEPHWLAAHPAGRFDRSLAISADGVDVLALANADGALELRRFAPSALAEQAPATPQDPAAVQDALAQDAVSNAPPPAPPAAPSASWPIADVLLTADARSDATLLRAGTTQLVLARSADQRVTAEWLDPTTPEAPRHPIGETAGTTPWITACRDEGTSAESVVAFGSEGSLQLVRLGHDESGAPSVKPLATAMLALDRPLTTEDPHADRVRIRCASGRIALLALSTAGELVAITCQGDSCAQRTLAQGVASFDAVLLEPGRGPDVMLAWSGKRDPSILVSSLRHGAAPSAPRSVAGCWDPAAGLCGAPTLTALEERIVLASRDGSELRALESRDAGQTWHALASLAGAAPKSTDPLQPMDQHRLRKGLDK